MVVNMVHEFPRYRSSPFPLTGEEREYYFVRRVFELGRIALLPLQERRSVASADRVETVTFMRYA